MVHQNFHLLLPYLPQGPGLGSESLVSLTFPLPHGLGLGFPGGSDGKEFTCNAGDLGLIPGLGRSLGEGNGYPLQLPREFHGQRSLVGYSPWGHKESDRTE